MSVSEATQSTPGPSYDSTPLLQVEGLVTVSYTHLTLPTILRV